MRYVLFVTLFLISANAPALDDSAALDKALADSAAIEAKDKYNEGINAKLANKFGDARIIFSNLADFPQPGTDQWSRLAADELRYGLPMHEAKYWLLKMGTVNAAQAPVDMYLGNAEKKLRQVIELNIDNPERIMKAQELLSQSAISRQAFNNVNKLDNRNKLTKLKISLALFFQDSGKWPDNRWLAQELETVLTDQGAPRKLWKIHKYWNSDAGFYLILKNSDDGSMLTMKANDKGTITME